MSEDPQARPRKQVCIQRGAGFRQEEARQGLPARLQRNASCPLHPLHSSHWVRKVWGQGTAERTLALPGGRTGRGEEPIPDAQCPRPDLTPKYLADLSNGGTPGLLPRCQLCSLLLLSREGP